MRLYIKGDYSKKIPYGYLELAGRMWFPEDKQVSYSNAGNNDDLQENFFSNLSLRKYSVDNRWKDLWHKLNLTVDSLEDEPIELEFENAFATDYNERGECLRILSSHLNILTVDKRAMYIMAIEVATVIDGQISEDDKESWLSIEEFKHLHKDILSLSYDEATDISLEEIKTMEAIKDPLWDEEERLRETYIKLHGERVYDEEEDE